MFIYPREIIPLFFRVSFYLSFFTFFTYFFYIFFQQMFYNFYSCTLCISCNESWTHCQSLALTYHDLVIILNKRHNASARRAFGACNLCLTLSTMASYSKAWHCNTAVCRVPHYHVSYFIGQFLDITTTKCVHVHAYALYERYSILNHLLSTNNIFCFFLANFNDN